MLRDIQIRQRGQARETQETTCTTGRSLKFSVPNGHRKSIYSDKQPGSVIDTSIPRQFPFALARGQTLFLFFYF